jgi:hypothetical protein
VTLLVPARADSATPAPAARERPETPRRLWRRVLTRSILVPLVVLMPLVALAPTADHRFNLYWHGGLFRDDPLRIVPHTLNSVHGYLTLGNFRPLGRMLEKALDLLAYTVADLLSVPVTIPFRLVSFTGAVVLTMTAVLLAESVVASGRLFTRAPSRLAATLPFAVGGGFVAAGSASPAVLFGGLYLLSAALVLGVSAVVCRVDHRLRWWAVVLLVPAGAALASVNELAYLALPLATVAVVVRQRVVLRHRWRQIGGGPAVRSLLLLWSGFLPVFVAVRLVIRGYCAAGPCYRGSELAIGPRAAEAIPARMLAWLPPLMWRSATQGAHRPWLFGAVTVLALLVLGGLAWRTIRDLPALTPVSRRQAAGVAAVAGAALLLGATLGSLNADVQTLVAHHRWGQGWRDTAVTAAAGAVLLAALLHGLAGRRVAILVLLFALVATVSTAADKSYRDQLAPREPALLANRIAQEMADFDRTPAGDARRCALRAEFRAVYAASPFSLRRFDESLDVAAEQQAGTRFCVAESR